MADLAALLDKEAGAEIEAILSEARQRASEIVAAAEQEAEALLAGRRRSAQSQYEAALVRARSAAQLEASSLKLRAQHAAVEAVFQEALQRLERLTKEPAYAEVLQRLLSEALSASGVAPAEVHSVTVAPADREPAAAAARALGLSGKIETDPTVRGGVRLRGAATGATIENTLYGRLEALREELAADVAQVLSKEG